MRKTKIYLDTSVIGHLYTQDLPSETNDVLKLWEELKQGKYDTVISELTFTELSESPEEKQNVFSEFINEIDYMELSISEEAETLAGEYINNGVLAEKHYDDCLHLALATVSNCDIVVSRNFKHMVRYKTIEGVRSTNAKNGYYKSIDIIPPAILIEAEE
jgi:predicted nucleic acid-binding protein